MVEVIVKLIIIAVAMFVGALCFEWAWNVFMVQILSMKEITPYQAFAACILLSSFKAPDMVK